MDDFTCVPRIPSQLKPQAIGLSFTQYKDVLTVIDHSFSFQVSPLHAPMRYEWVPYHLFFYPLKVLIVAHWVQI